MNMSVGVERFTGEVLGHNGPDRGVADDISYRVCILDGDGQSVFNFIAPCNRRPDVEVYAARNGTTFTIYRVGTEMRFDIPEQVYHGDCE